MRCAFPPYTPPLCRWRGFLRLALGDRRVAREEEAGALDDRHVDHLAVDGNGADPACKRLVVGGDDPLGVVDLGLARAKFLVQNLDLARVDDAGADKSDAARA